MAAFKLEVWRVSRALGQNGINPKSTTPPLPGIEDTWGTLESHIQGAFQGRDREFSRFALRSSRENYRPLETSQIGGVQMFPKFC